MVLKNLFDKRDQINHFMCMIDGRRRVGITASILLFSVTFDLFSLPARVLSRDHLKCQGCDFFFFLWDDGKRGLSLLLAETCWKQKWRCSRKFQVER